MSDPLVLHLSYSNAAGLPEAWARAHREAGVEAMHVAEVENRFGFPSQHVVRWSTGSKQNRFALYPYLSHATHIVIHDMPGYVEFVRGLGKPYLYRAFGTASYKQLNRVKAMVPKQQRVCDLAEYVRHGFAWEPMPIWRGDYPQGLRYTVFSPCHAPSHREAKGTAAVIRACQAADMRLVLIEDKPHRRCLEQKARCHALIDMLADEHARYPERLTGYAVNGLEAMAMGIPVLGEASHQTQVDQQRLFGDVLPFINVTEASLPAALARLREDKEFYAEQVARAGWYLAQFHDPHTQARINLGRLGL